MLLRSIIAYMGADSRGAAEENDLVPAAQPGYCFVSATILTPLFYTNMVKLFAMFGEAHH